MSDTTIRCIVWYALLTALFFQVFGLKAQTRKLTTQEICTLEGKDYDPHLKPVPGCVVRLPAAPEPQAKPSFELNIPYPSPSPTNVHDYALSRLKVGLEWKEIPANKDIYTIGLFTYNWKFRDKKVQKFSIDPTGKVELDNMSADDAILLLASDLVMEQRKAKPPERAVTHKNTDVDNAIAMLTAPETEAGLLVDAWLNEHGTWHKLRWRDWSCYKVSYMIDGKGRSMFSCKLNVTRKGKR
jgi:hypothetical protein